MENYKKILLNKVKFLQSCDFENALEENKPLSKPIERAYYLIDKIISDLFYKKLKLYNNDERRAYDHFVANEILNELNLFIEYFLILDVKPEDTSSPIFITRKKMRTILNLLFIEIK